MVQTKMNNRWLIIDTDYLCHRAKYTTGDLSYKGAATGVIFGVLKYVLSLQEQFRTNNVVFCWDSRHSKRKKVYPQYKANRKLKQLTPKEQRFERRFRKQMKRLRTEYLTMIGYRSVFHQKGYEADDLIAVCKNFIYSLPSEPEIIIVSADHDLYQLIDDRTSLYHPQTNKTMTLQSFKKKYGIEPNMWIGVKAIGGCSTDNIKGLPGVGEKTAIKILTEQLPKKSKAMIAWNSKKGKKIIARNLQLVALPFPGTKTVRIRSNKLSEKGWRKVCKLLGFSSLRDRSFPKVPE